MQKNWQKVEDGEKPRRTRRMMACRSTRKINRETLKEFNTERRSNGSGMQRNGWVLEAALCGLERRRFIKGTLLRLETTEAGPDPGAVTRDSECARRLAVVRKRQDGFRREAARLMPFATGEKSKIPTIPGLYGIIGPGSANRVSSTHARTALLKEPDATRSV